MDGSASQLAGKKAVVAVTAGVPADHYTPKSSNQATIETLLSNWHATVRLCQFDIQPMVKLYGTPVASPKTTWPPPPSSTTSCLPPSQPDRTLTTTAALADRDAAVMGLQVSGRFAGSAPSDRRSVLAAAVS
ncbi:NAD(P)H-dependent oxidoreductase [Streptomyces sp. CB01635]|uniref:NAD(P)H-dependent oxidoreductase n=1 Tax=unclassified Streptomyces TaxID=2593676 RepID=UPI001F334420|nr:NAD(P)H-dependent oxidoreductase [Streptomyces sp. CB01635]